MGTNKLSYPLHYYMSVNYSSLPVDFLTKIWEYLNTRNVNCKLSRVIKELFKVMTDHVISNNMKLEVFLTRERVSKAKRLFESIFLLLR